MDSRFDWIDDENQHWRDHHLERRLVAQPPRAHWLDFASNDYLNLANDPRVVQAARRAIREHGWGASASPAITGWRAPHAALAAALARFEQTEAALLFPTGFAANQGVIQTLVSTGDAIFVDRLAHACIVAGAKASGATVRVFPHNDAAALDRSLARHRGRFRRILIATEGLFSMDGDVAPLSDLLEIAERHGAMLHIDEAHATGILGTRGKGASEAAQIDDRLEYRVGTLSKALGSVGGFVCGTRRIIQRLTNSAPPFLFSTSLPAAAPAAALAALSIFETEPARRERLLVNARTLAETLRVRGWRIPPIDGPIVPIPIGEADATLARASTLRERGIVVGAVRPPTVPAGSSRLRVSVSCAHEAEHLEALVEALGTP